MSQSTTAATRQYEMKLNITLPTMIAGAAVRTARPAADEGARWDSESAIECFLPVGRHRVRSDRLQNAFPARPARRKCLRIRKKGRTGPTGSARRLLQTARR